MVSHTNNYGRTRTQQPRWLWQADRGRYPLAGEKSNAEEVFCVEARLGHGSRAAKSRRSLGRVISRSVRKNAGGPPGGTLEQEWDSHLSVDLSVENPDQAGHP